MKGTQTNNQTYSVTLYLNGIESATHFCDTFKEAQEIGQKWRERAEDNWADTFDYVISDEVEQYTGAHYVGEIIRYKGKYSEHECKVTHVWNVDGKNGVSIIPTGNYGFEIDVYEDLLND